MANKRLNAIITIGGAVASTLGSAFATVKREAGSVVADLAKRQRELNAVMAEQSKLGASGSALKVQYAQQELDVIGKQIAALKRKQALENSITQGFAANASRRAELRGKVLDTVALGATAAAPIVAAVKFETAMTGIAKQVQGARDAQGQLTPLYYEFGKAIQQLGRELPIPTNEIANMVTAAARMNIANEDLLPFVRTAAMMGTAFEMPAAQLSEDMGKIAGIFKIPMKEIAGLGDAINYLDDNSIATASDIIKVMKGDLAGAASTMGLSAKNAAALASTFLQLGETAERADTAASGMLRQLQIAKMNPRKFQVGVEMLGMTADQLQKGMISDTQGTILKVLDRIKALPQEKQMEAVTRLFGKDWGGAIAKLAGGVEEYRRQLELANGPKAAGSMSREFQTKMQTTAAKWELLKNTMTEFAVVTGDAVLPAVKDIVDGLRPVIGLLSDAKREHPLVTKAVIGTAMALAGLRIATLGAGYAWTFAKDAWLLGRLALVRLAPVITWLGATALPALLAAVRPVVLAFAIAGAPIWAVVGAVAAVAAAGVLVYKYWEPLKSFFSGFFEGMATALAPIAQAFNDAFAPVWNVIGPVVMPVLETVGGWVRSAVGWFGELLSPISAASETTRQFGEAGKVCGEVVGAAFRFMLTPIEAVLNAIKWINDNVGAVINKVGALWSNGGNQADLGVGFDAMGNPTGSLPDIPAPAARGATVNDNSQTTFNITQQPGQDAKALADEIARRQRAQAGVRQRGALVDGVGAQ
jgi:TP901 family phage tail tape measure protein